MKAHKNKARQTGDAVVMQFQKYSKLSLHNMAFG